MKNFFLGLLILLLLAITIQCTKPLTFTCDVDTQKQAMNSPGRMMIAWSGMPRRP